MLKVIKRYRMPLKSSPTSSKIIAKLSLSLICSFYFADDIIPGRDTIFSSYPGTLHSIGEFVHSFSSPIEMFIESLIR